MTRSREKAAARVAQEIVQTIYDEKLAPGSRYLSEAEALVRHGVSRSTFREALRFLEFQGVVRVKAGPGGGAIVQRPDWPHLTSTFALLLQFADAPLSAVMTARSALEPAMAGLAAEKATPALIARLEDLLGTAERNLGEASAFIDAYRAYWGTLAQCTGNAVTAMLWPALRALVDSGGFVPNERYRAVLIARMRALLDAVRRRDVDGARALVTQHDAEAIARLSQNYPQRISRPLAWSDVVRDDPS